MFSVYNIISLGIGTLLGIGIPIAAAVIFKLKNRNAWLPSVFVGAAVFLVFAMILEQILHSAMIPIVSESTFAYCLYGILAAGIFEETGRFIAYKTLMKKHYSTANAVFMGIGHGGFEAIVLLGLNMSGYFFMAISIGNTGNIEQITAQYSPELAETVKAQLEAVSQVGLGDIALSIFERLLAMIFHVCMSVWVYKAASQKRKEWLYPAAVLTHAVLDLSAVLYQVGAITELAAVYVPMTVLVAGVAFITVRIVKGMADKDETGREL